ncbi:hypothetical protein NW752_010332 [Fusarium irregulare]|nr:hypothetical protein NW752_010332 [Fusarium irregulare]
MLGQIRQDEIQFSAADGPFFNELVSYSDNRPKIGVKNRLLELAWKCSHAAATAMGKLSMTQPESLIQNMNNRVQKIPPEQHEDPTPLCAGTHEYTVPSPEFMYQFRGSPALYVGFEDKVRPDRIQVDRWEKQVLPRLLTDIKEFEKKMRRSSKTRRSRHRLSIAPELRMSGYVIEATNKVKLLPRIWILYGHDTWRKSVQKFVKELEWLSLEGFGEVEVHPGGPKLSALESSSMILGLDFNEDHMYYLDQRTTLYLHVEQTEGDSACGLVCCATVMRDGAVMSQRLSRIGGILHVNDKPFGVTTAHGMLEWFVDACLEGQDDDEPSDDEPLNSPIASDAEEDEAMSAPDQNESTVADGTKYTNRVRQWSQVSALGLTAFLQTSYHLSPDISPIIQRRSLEHVRGHRLSQDETVCPDFSLWGFQDSETLENAYTMGNGKKVFIDAPASCYDAPEGPVQLLLGNDSPVPGFLLPGTRSFFVHGSQFKTRKIRTTHPLGQGCSGASVVRDAQLQGVIIASYDHEPYAHIITTDDLLANIKAIASEDSIQLPRQEPFIYGDSTPDLSSCMCQQSVVEQITTTPPSGVDNSQLTRVVLESRSTTANDDGNGGHLANTKLQYLNAEGPIKCYVTNFGTKLWQETDTSFLATLIPRGTPGHSEENAWNATWAITSTTNDHCSAGIKTDDIANGLDLKLSKGRVDISKPSVSIACTATPSTEGPGATSTDWRSM